MGRRLESAAMLLGLLLPTLALPLAGCGGSSSGGGGAPNVAATAAPVASSTAAPIVSSLPGSGPMVVASGRIEALTYNVAGLPQGISSSSPVTNIPQISPKLNAYDLALAQEDFAYPIVLASLAQHPYRTTPMAATSSLMNDGLNRFSRTPFNGFERTRWRTFHGVFNHSNDGLAAKGFTFARHELVPGFTVDVYNLHADAGRHAGDNAARADQFAQLRDVMLTLSANQAVIVAGDTNLKASDPLDEQVLVDFMTATGLRDVARTLGNLPESIDRFLFRGSADLELDPQQWRFADEFVDASGAPLSDHEAVHVTFAWRAVR